MAEAVGLAVGFAGLAGLFSSCVDCFKLVQIYGSRSHDYELLQTMLDNQQFHFMAWGKACGFMDTDNPNRRFDDVLSGQRNNRIEQTMEKIQSLLTNSDNLKEKYGLKKHRGSMGTKGIEGPTISAFSRVFQNTRAFYNTSLQRTSHISGAIRWVVNDKDMFEGLVQNLRNLIDDLIKLTDEFGVTGSQRLIVEYELEKINDEQSLEAITAASACDDDDDLISLAASRQLSRIKAHSVINQPIGLDDGLSMISAHRFTPSVSTLVEEEMEGTVQEIGITRKPLSEWRKLKTRPGIMAWLSVLVAATVPSTSFIEMQDEIRPISRVNTLNADVEAPEEHAVRLAINSQALIGVLRKITACNISQTHNVLVYPFKPLLVYENDLRRYFAEIQEKLRKLMSLQNSEKLVDDDSVEQEDDSKLKVPGRPISELEKTKRIVDEMECLMEFIDNDMRELLNVRKQITDKSLHKIKFEHLWLLFRPGVLMTSSDKSSDRIPTGYQILHVTGGRPILDLENFSQSEAYDSYGGWENRDAGYAITSSRECTDFIIDCFYLDYNGTAYGPRPETFIITEYTGERDITSLTCYPLDSPGVEARLRTDLLNRGKKFVQCTMGNGRFFYSGPVLRELDPHHRQTCQFCVRKNLQERAEGEVMIDHTTALENSVNIGCNWQMAFGGGIITQASKANRREVFEAVNCSNPSCKACTDVFNDAAVDLHLRDRFIRSSKCLKAMHRKDFDEEQSLIMSYRLCGFTMQHRKWHPLHVDSVTHVDSSNPNALDDLVLPEGHKSRLSTLTKGQKQDTLQDGKCGKNLFEKSYFVKSRRRGTLVLLHGPPGVGKTSTAEALAASLNKPLFWLRIADFGSTAREMEPFLIMFFQLAERWGCIVLIRDAEILLDQRTRADREGNSITSVFVDSLEYFTGIMIFVTSHAGAFNEAIMSRIHMSLYYPPLDMDSTMSLWETTLNRLKNDQSLIIHWDDIIDFAKRHYQLETNRWNGRQIRSGIATALAMAREDAVRQGKEVAELNVKHFDAVLYSSQQFSEYLQAVSQSDDLGRARSPSIRTDQFQNQIHEGARVSPTPIQRTIQHVGPVSVRPYAIHSDTSVASHDYQSDEDDLEVEELEIKLQMAKLRRQQKALNAERARRHRERNGLISETPESSKTFR
ncbi:hypothetical protein CC78DRAFT_621906 [Lojkania enalia]|uniref:AAA+ ATPase domain-containing protein n=1 Tax=Lojkania enalia TaxID=147567 RepID=A0A9P4JWA0_9PLEO|nr:hypothetical protein CC78DRAFT_621906 [Didymosphaeria enalia]